jgi:glycosyltransferase involved in cell wall biosynthesis
MIEEWQNADFSISMREKSKVTMAAFPFKIAESMCLGTPVITNDTSNITEYVKDKVNGVIIPFDYESAAKKIFVICSNKDLVYNIKKNCISNNPFDYNTYKEEIIKFLNKL